MAWAELYILYKTKHYITFLPHMLEVEPRSSYLAHTHHSAIPPNQPWHLDFFVKDASDLHAELSVAQVLPCLTLHPHSFIENATHSSVLSNSPPTPLMHLLLPSLTLQTSQDYILHFKDCTFSINGFKLRICCFVLNKQLSNHQENSLYSYVCFVCIDQISEKLASSQTDR